MQFINVKENDEIRIKSIYQIIKLSGEYMVNSLGLYHWDKPYPIEKIVEDCSDKYVYIVEENNQYIATFMLSFKTSYFFQEYPNKTAMYISKFAVNPQIVHKGVGTKCMKFIENTARNYGKDTLRLDVYDKSIQAVNFYKKMGFQELYKRSTRRFQVFCMEKNI